MKPSVKHHFRKILTGCIVVFILLFVFRLIYGYGTVITDSEESYSSSDNFRTSTRNYASKEYHLSDAKAMPVPSKVDQKYEKVAQLNAKSNAYEADENKARNYVEKAGAIIQFEQKTGNAGKRVLHLTIGVPPVLFDTLYDNLSGIGRIVSRNIIKTDKTNEYKELNAQKASLEKIRASLIELKTKNGRIDEYMSLENRILEIEEELQRLGVSLGDFDDNNEFCTVKFSLREEEVKTIRFMHRVKVALEWTARTYFWIFFSALFTVLFAWLLIAVIDKLRKILTTYTGNTK
jgi:hypothetical protein